MTIWGACLRCMCSPALFPWCFLQTNRCLVGRSGVALTTPGLVQVDEGKLRSFSDGQGSSFLWKQTHTLTPCCCCRVFIASGAVGQVRDGRRSAALLGVGSATARPSPPRSTAVGRGRAQPERNVWVCCCCCFPPNGKSPCISDHQYRVWKHSQVFQYLL